MRRARHRQWRHRSQPVPSEAAASTHAGISSFWHLAAVQHKPTPESSAVWQPRSRSYGWYIVGLLTAINLINYLDRMVVVTMYDDLRRIFHFSNGQLGALSSGFFLVHALATLPLGWASDRFDRRRVMAAGVLAWSAWPFHIERSCAVSNDQCPTLRPPSARSNASTATVPAAFCASLVGGW